MKLLGRLISMFFGERLRALIVKETKQILRDKQQLFLLMFPPIVQICLYGAALNPDVQYLRMGVVDEAKTYKSRELVSAIVENRVFKISRVVDDLRALTTAVERGKLDAGLVIPP